MKVVLKSNVYVLNANLDIVDDFAREVHHKASLLF